jgi:hypothetical protein
VVRARIFIEYTNIHQHGGMNSQTPAHSRYYRAFTLIPQVPVLAAIKIIVCHLDWKTNKKREKEVAKKGTGNTNCFLWLT